MRGGAVLLYCFVLIFLCPPLILRKIKEGGARIGMLKTVEGLPALFLKK